MRLSEAPTPMGNGASARLFLRPKLGDDRANLISIFGFRREAQVLLQLLDGAGVVVRFNVDRAEIAVRLDGVFAADADGLQQLFFSPVVNAEVDERLAEMKMRCRR